MILLLIKCSLFMLMKVLCQLKSITIAERVNCYFKMVGVNGAGKTTTIGKLAHRIVHDEGKKVVVAAGDTFRAGAIDQLAVWAERVGVDIVKGKEGGDPSAVVFDALNKAKETGADVLICCYVVFYKNESEFNE